MEKKYFLLAAFALLTITASAQKFKALGGQPKKMTAKMERMMVPEFSEHSLRSFAPKKSSKVKAQLPNNQKYVGYDMEEDVDKAINRGLPQYPQDEVWACTMLGKDILSAYAGCRAVGMRFALNASIGGSTVFGILYNGELFDGESPAFEQEVASTNKGWNTVMFDNPYTITTNGVEGLLIGYTYDQIADSSDPASSPMMFSGTQVDNGFLMGVDIGDGWGLYSLGAGGNLMVQLIVENPNGDFAAFDLSLHQIITNPFSKLGEVAPINLIVSNKGSDVVTNATFGVSIDGKEYGDFPFDGELTNEKKTLEVGLPLPENLAIGEHEITISVKDVQNASPIGYLGDDAISTKFKVYSKDLKRQKSLIENFTSMVAKAGIPGNKIVDGIMNGRPDVICASHHYGLSSGDDAFEIEDNKYLASVLIHNLPAVSLNRFYVDSELNEDYRVGLPTGYSSQYVTQVANVYGQVIDAYQKAYPSFSNFNITTSYNASTRKLNVKVDGLKIADFEKVFGEKANLTIYLTEDGLKKKQMKEDGMFNVQYVNNHVVRKVVTDQFGDEIHFNGNSFTMEYNDIAVDASWSADKMSVIAFVARPIDVDWDENLILTPQNDMWIDNADVCKLGESVTAIVNVDADGNKIEEVARYTIDGRRIYSPVKGMNIVKMSNGETKKVLVR